MYALDVTFEEFDVRFDIDSDFFHGSGEEDGFACLQGEFVPF